MLRVVKGYACTCSQSYSSLGKARIVYESPVAELTVPCGSLETFRRRIVENDTFARLCYVIFLTTEYEEVNDGSYSPSA
jgi:hypothetical protein